MSKNKSSKDKSSSKEEKPSVKRTPKEIGGRKGLDPVRYGDWENNGIASDF